MFSVDIQFKALIVGFEPWKFLGLLGLNSFDFLTSFLF